MRDVAGTLVGKSLKFGLSFRKAGGQALPGLVIESLFPSYVASMLKKLPDGVIIITGTNGKTTTTKIVTHLLKVNGKKVLTNSTGSNLVRGIASSLSQHAKISGKLPYDLAVLEVDEATARQLVKQVKPRWVLGLNVSRDQLDRFGEVDTVAAYVGTAMQAANGVVTNANDPHLLDWAKKIKQQNNADLHYFGVNPRLAKFFPSDYDLASVDSKVQKPVDSLLPDVELYDFDGQLVTYLIDGKKYKTSLKLTGQHNYLNGAAALALVRHLLNGVSDQTLINQLADVRLAFGRGETYKLSNGSVIELVLVKNPASFSQALASYGAAKQNLMIAINDNIADGRDVSWLWDVDFSALNTKVVAIASGRRAADLALRLSYSEVSVSTIEPNLISGLKLLSQTKGKKVILATYTAMLVLHKQLAKQDSR